MEKTGDTKQIHCNVCLLKTRHAVLFSKRQQFEEQGEEPHDYYCEISDYFLAECNGCNHITLLVENSVNGESSELQYPPLLMRKQPKWLMSLIYSEDWLNPIKYDFIKEIYRAVQNHTPRLAVIGIRALLEHVMLEKVGDHGTFKSNLDKFQQDGFISKVQRTAIESVLEAGHASTHRGFKAKDSEIEFLLDITENLIAAIYVNEANAKKLEVPPRKPRK